MPLVNDSKESKDIAKYVVANIEKALENGWVKVYYQPVVRALTGQLCGAESLARWIDPEVGFLPPNQFIGALEESRQIHKLDCWIVRHSGVYTADRDCQIAVPFCCLIVYNTVYDV